MTSYADRLREQSRLDRLRPADADEPDAGLAVSGSVPLVTLRPATPAADDSKPCWTARMDGQNRVCIGKATEALGPGRCARPLAGAQALVVAEPGRARVCVYGLASVVPLLTPERTPAPQPPRPRGTSCRRHQRGGPTSAAPSKPPADNPTARPPHPTRPDSGETRSDHQPDRDRPGRDRGAQRRRPREATGRDGQAHRGAPPRTPR